MLPPAAAEANVVAAAFDAAQSSDIMRGAACSPTTLLRSIPVSSCECCASPPAPLPLKRWAPMPLPALLATEGKISCGRQTRLGMVVLEAGCPCCCFREVQEQCRPSKEEIEALAACKTAKATSAVQRFHAMLPWGHVHAGIHTCLMRYWRNGAVRLRDLSAHRIALEKGTGFAVLLPSFVHGNATQQMAITTAFEER
eukprot:4663423-Pleurochrysis_carterae.AAC.10